jgi:hypothetical protein
MYLIFKQLKILSLIGFCYSLFVQSAFAVQVAGDPFAFFNFKTPRSYQELILVSDLEVLNRYKNKMSVFISIADQIDEQSIAEIIDAYNLIRTFDKRVEYCKLNVFITHQSFPNFELSIPSDYPDTPPTLLSSVQISSIMDQQIEQSLGVIEGAARLGLSSEQIREAKMFFAKINQIYDTPEYWKLRKHTAHVTSVIDSTGQTQLRWNWETPHYRDIDFGFLVPSIDMGDLFFVRENQNWIKRWIDQHDVLANYRLEAMLELKRLEQKSKFNTLTKTEQWKRIAKDLLLPLEDWHARQVQPFYSSGDFEAFRQGRPSATMESFFDAPAFSTYVNGPYLKPIINNLMIELIMKYLDLSQPSLFSDGFSVLSGEPGMSETWHRTLNYHYKMGFFDSWINHHVITTTDETGFYNELRNFMFFNSSRNGYSHLLYIPRYDIFELIERSNYYHNLPESKRDSFLILKRLIELTDQDPGQYLNLKVPEVIHEIYRHLHALNDKVLVDAQLNKSIKNRVGRYMKLALAGVNTKHHYFYSRSTPELRSGMNRTLSEFVLSNFPYSKIKFTYQNFANGCQLIMLGNI